MESLDFSRTNLNRFLQRVDDLGLLPANTARTRKTAVRRLFTHLTEHEAADLRNANVDELLDRLARAENAQRPEGEQIGKSSRRTYHSRVLSVLKDFYSWVEDSAGFERRLMMQRVDSKKASEAQENELQSGRVLQTNLSQSIESGIVVPIPIRGNLHVVYVRNLPIDLSAEDVEKIHAVLTAMAGKL